MTYSRDEFEKLLFPLGIDQFLKKHWNQAPAVLRDPSRERVPKLFPAFRGRGSVLNWLSLLPLAPDTTRTQLLMPAGDEREHFGRVTPVQVTSGVAQKLFVEGSAGATVIFGVEQLDADARRFQTLLLELTKATGRAEVCAYAHGKTGGGADLHFDESPVIQINLLGKRRWRFTSKPVLPWSRVASYQSEDGLIHYNEDGIQRVIDPDQVELEDVTLEPGDILYLPPCTPHCTESTGEPSIAISCLFYGARTDEVIKEALDQYLFGKVPGFRTPGLDGDPTVVRKPLQAGLSHDAAYVQARIADFAAFICAPTGLAELEACVQQQLPARVDLVTPPAPSFGLQRPQRFERTYAGPVHILPTPDPNKRIMVYDKQQFELDEPHEIAVVDHLYANATLSISDVVQWCDGACEEEQAEQFLRLLVGVGILRPA